jgi:hypothetical protein
MTCIHLQQLYKTCQEQQLKLSSSDLIHIVCKQCEKQEVCPSVLVEEYEAEHLEEEEKAPAERPS